MIRKVKGQPSYIFNLSWSTHTFPSAWKQSTIIPILKPGKPSDSPSSYRPISLTSCTSKLFERMVLGRLTYFLELHDILSPVQAGFRPGRSTVDQVLLLSQSIADSFHQSKPGARTVLATVDFAKAFDSVWHSALLSKLLSLDLPLCFVEWIRSYLSDRRSKVRICNSYSRPFRLRRGVPQGSVLGPVLFSLYINDLPTFLPASVKTSLYADDLAIWASSPRVESATAVVQAALNRLVEWSSKWRLPLNPLKCETSFFSLDPYQSRIQPSQIQPSSNLSRCNLRPHSLFQISRLILTEKVSQPISCFSLHCLCLLGPIKRILMYPIQSLHSPHPHLCFPRLVSLLISYTHHLRGEDA